MSDHDDTYIKDIATVNFETEEKILMGEKSGNIISRAGNYLSQFYLDKDIKLKKEKEKSIEDIIAKQQLDALLDRLNEIAKRLGEIADEIDKTAKELEALRELKKLELAGKLDPNNPEHILLFQQAGIGVNDSIDDAINDRISYMQQLHNEWDSLIAEEQQIHHNIKKNYPNLATDHPEYKKIYDQKLNERQLLQRVKDTEKKFEDKVNIEEARNKFRIKNKGNSKLFESSSAESKHNEYDFAIDANADNLSDPFANVKDSTTSFANTVDNDDPFAETAGNISDPFNEVAAVLTEQEKTLQSDHNTQANLNQDSLNLSMK